MVDDEMAFAAKLGPKITDEVDLIARAMCNASARSDGDGNCTCATDGGTCCAFGLFGGLAYAAKMMVTALR